VPDLTFLDSKHSIYETHEAEWRREERRVEGGEAVRDELVRFSHEDDDSFAARLDWARWVNYARVHTTILSGHLVHNLPIPNYASLGTVRPRGDIEGKQSKAELFHYNCDGIGSDGQSLPAFIDGVEQDALATRFRWLRCELPTGADLKAIRVRLGTALPDSDVPEAPFTVTEEEEMAGFHPFWVADSPLCWTNWRFINGVLVWAVGRVHIEPTTDFADGKPVNTLGYYLCVRRGYTGLGEDFAAGGWWKYDSEKLLVEQGDYSDTDGQIPLWLHIGKPGHGTHERPSIGQSLTTELGQISADQMNATSEQRFNLRQAAKSVTFGLGMEPSAHKRVIEQLGDGSIFVAVPGQMNPQGEFTVPTLWNSAEAAMASEAYGSVITAAVAEAKEVMVRQIMAAPDASGARVEAEHQSATVPLLSQLAETMEQSINTGLYFTLRRFGKSHEEASAASVEMDRDFTLRDIVNDIDQMLGTMEKAQVSSPTWKRLLVEQKGEEMDLLPADERDQIVGEMTASTDLKVVLEVGKLRTEYMKLLIDTGADERAAAKEAGFTDAQINALFGSVEQPAGDDDEEDEENVPRRPVAVPA
jgi:hypothetical protein